MAEQCFIHFTCGSIKSWRSHAHQAVQFLDLNRTLLDSYVLDFFTEDLWSRLNPEWVKIFNTFTPSDLASFIHHGTLIRQSSVWPLSLLAFRASCHSLALPRKAVTSSDPLVHYLRCCLQTEPVNCDVSSSKADEDEFYGTRKEERRRRSNNREDRKYKYKKNQIDESSARSSNKKSECCDFHKVEYSIAEFNTRGNRKSGYNKTEREGNISFRSRNSECEEGSECIDTQKDDMTKSRENNNSECSDKNNARASNKKNEGSECTDIKKNKNIIEKCTTIENIKQSQFHEGQENGNITVRRSGEGKYNGIQEDYVVTTSESSKQEDKESGQCSEIKEEMTRVSPVQQINVLWGNSDAELSAAAGQHKLLQHVFRRHLKPKKQHEVARLAIIAGQVARAACEGVMVDVGSGQGHLSRLLAYGHDVRVVSLEAEDKFIEGARKFDRQLEKAVTKMTKRQTDLPLLPPGPRHAVCHLQPNMDPHAFTTVIREVWPELRAREVCGLLGLHTCGDLAPTLLRIFTSMTTCQAIVSVGCCYMKLTTASDDSGSPGYPMSSFVDLLSGHRLSYEAREVACHALEMYHDRLALGTDHLKVHCYRACLEEILVRHWPHHRHAGLRSVNNAHLMDFATYSKLAVSRLQDVELPEADLRSDETLHNLTRWQQVVVYYSLRLLLAPVVESVVLLDRLFFLYENGLEGILFPAFDPHLSPRNHVLVAVKPNNKL